MAKQTTASTWRGVAVGLGMSAGLSAARTVMSVGSCDARGDRIIGPMIGAYALICA